MKWQVTIRNEDTGDQYMDQYTTHDHDYPGLAYEGAIMAVIQDGRSTVRGANNITIVVERVE